MGLDLNYIDGQTPIEEEEKECLKLKSISTRAELDEFEQANIEKAVEWSLKMKFSRERILTIDFIKEVHRQMFSEVWTWAGKFRRTNKNIGVDKLYIEQELYKLMGDVNYWIDEDIFGEDEISIRFSHRLVSIHPFPNGNGRHSRLCADILITHAFGRSIFSWGGKELISQGVARTKYLQAIYAADKGNIAPLLEFARMGSEL